MQKKQGKWGIMIGSPTNQHPYPIEALSNPYGKGTWMTDLTFATRREARARAKECAEFNRFWNFHPKKRP